MILKVVIIGCLIFLVFRSLFFLKSKVQIAESIKGYLAYMLPIAELLVWIVFLVWIFHWIYRLQNYFVLVAVAVVVLLFSMPLHVLLRDFVMGTILKIQNKINEGLFIEIDEIKGRIKRAGLLRLDIEDDRGNINSIPYNHIRSKIISQPGSNQKLAKVLLQFSFPENTQVNYITPILIQQILNTPWTAVSQAPIIEKAKKENGQLIVEVGVYTLDKSYGENIKNSVDKSRTPLG